MPSPNHAARPAVPTRVVHSTGLSRAALDAILDAHARALATGEGVLKNGRRSAVTRVQHGTDGYCVKETRPLGLVCRIKDWLRGHRADLAWRAAQRLAACGITTPEPVAVVERSGARFLVTRFIDGATSLNRLLAERFAGPLSRAEVAAKRTMLRQLGAWLRRLHDEGIYHDDWSLKNILARQCGEAWEFYLLDLESMPPYKWLTTRRRAKNLGQANDAPAGITDTDRMRLLLAYAGADTRLARGRFPRAIHAFTQRRHDLRQLAVERRRRRTQHP